MRIALNIQFEIIIRTFYDQVDTGIEKVVFANKFMKYRNN